MSEALRAALERIKASAGNPEAVWQIATAALAQPPAPTAQPATEDDLRVYDAIAAGYAQPVQQPGAEPQPSGYESTTTCYTRWVSPERWAKFSPGVQKWYRPYWAPAQRQPLTAEAVFASKDFMSMNGLYWGLGIETLMQIVRVTERECAAAWGVTLAQKGEKL